MTRVSGAATMLAVTFAAVSLAVHAAPSRPGIRADLTDAARASAAKAGASPQAAYDAILDAVTPYLFDAHGVHVAADTRWFEGASVDGPGAPVLEVHRWPGDTILAFYELPAAGEAGAGAPAELKLGSSRGAAGAWSCRDASLAASRGDYEALWCETAGDGRRVGALGIPGDAGLGAPAIDDLRESIVAVLRHAKVDPSKAGAVVPPLLPQLPEPPTAADERKRSWAVFAADDFTLGLPPGIRAIRLGAGVPAPRTMPPSSTVWLRGRLTDRDGVSVAVGDETRAGYVSILSPPEETWTAGVAPPLGAPAAEQIDEAKLDDVVKEWTGASRAVVSHWKETGFAGDWLVFRLLVGGRGIEIGLPCVSGWRSLSLWWIPVTFRRDGLPPAPPPFDPGESLGVKFSRLAPAEAKRNGLLEGYLDVGDLRLEVPRGWWPIANTAARDGLPVTFVDATGVTIGVIDRRSKGASELTPDPGAGWKAQPRPSAQNAEAVWSKEDGSAVIVAKEGHGFLFEPAPDQPQRREGWKRMLATSAFVKTAQRR